MPKPDPRIDAYIARSPDFARPILIRLRAMIRKACPGVSETIKWGMPAFEHHGLLAHMAAFKAHCVFGFWKGELLFGKPASEQEAMGQFGRMTSVADLPPERRFAKWVKQAMALNEEGAKTPSRSRPKPGSGTRPARIAVPADVAAALRRSPGARKTFAAFPPSQKREYLDWITGARTEATRERRLGTAIGWMEEGKPRMWKYLKGNKGK